MTAPVPFLQRLAPAFREGAHAARPVLAPRFAPVDRGEPLATALPPSSGPLIPPPFDALPVVMPLVTKLDRPEGAQANARPMRRDDDPRYTPRPAARAVAPQDSTAPVVPRDAITPVLPTAARTDPTPAPIAHRHVDPAGDRPAPPPLPEAAAPAAALPAPRLAPTPGPLSAAALAQRPLAAPAPPVIHVTIDRLDVRLPTPAPAPAAVAAPRRAAATLPLADYLRQRRGGAR